MRTRRRWRELEEQLEYALAALEIANQQLLADFTPRPADLSAATSEELLAELKKRVTS